MEELYRQYSQIVFYFLYARCKDPLLSEDLMPDMKKVVELRTLGGLPYKEIGAVLGKSENWARVTFYRAKMLLMKEAGYGKDEL